MVSPFRYAEHLEDIGKKVTISTKPSTHPAAHGGRMCGLSARVPSTPKKLPLEDLESPWSSSSWPQEDQGLNRPGLGGRNLRVQGTYNMPFLVPLQVEVQQEGERKGLQVDI